MNNNLLEFVLQGKHHTYRREYAQELGRIYSEAGLSPVERMTDRFERLCAAQEPHILPGEKIVFLRTTSNIPDIFTKEEWEELRGEHFIHELGYVSNLSPNYEDTIRSGLLARREEADAYGRRVIDAVIALTDRYREEALRTGRDDVAQVLERVPRYGAGSFREALQFFRILHFALWLEGDYHNTVGRFDQYMYPYFETDMKSGALNEESALELLEDFFLSFNKDSDLYVGVQQGDNGQSMVLGGTDGQGNDCFNLLSQLCLKASGNLKLIDPKINLRVSKNTPLSVYELGTELTKAGLGFPQYSNDDVVIDGLRRLGYEEADAANYVIAACWEFIIPKCAFDVVNIAAVNFPLVVDRAVRARLETCGSFDELLAYVDRELRDECNRITGGIKNLWFVPSPFMGLLLDDIKYHNFGIHGSGIASATDALAAIKMHVFERKTLTPSQLIKALDSDFENDGELAHLLRYESPKMGNNDDYADDISVHLLDAFAQALEGKTNCMGGIYRAGTGTAMYYLWHAAQLGATADGRRRGEPFGTNFSPNLFAKTGGPVSVIKSFTKQHLKNVINGGPLTLEFSESCMNSAESIKKLSMLIKYFIDNGGHQLQLNAVNLEEMKDAQIHPERHRQLIVRIWGWSAYFVDLDSEYQNHVIARQEYSV